MQFNYLVYSNSVSRMSANSKIFYHDCKDELGAQYNYAIHYKMCEYQKLGTHSSVLSATIYYSCGGQ